MDDLRRRLTNLENDVRTLRSEVREDIHQLREDVGERFDRIDTAHERQARLAGAPVKVKWSNILATAIAVATAVGVPIAVAFIGAPK